MKKITIEPLAKSANNVTLSEAEGLGWWVNQIRSDAPPQILHSVQNDFCKSLHRYIIAPQAANYSATDYM